MSAKPSDAGVFLWMTYLTLQRMQLDAATIFASVNLPDQPPDKHTRRDNATQKRFWAAAEHVSQDLDIGLHVGDQMPTFRGQVVEYLFLSSANFGDGLLRVLRYQGLLSSAFKLNLRIENNIAILSGIEHPVRHYLECALCVLLKFLNHMSEHEFQATEIWFTHLQGAASEEYQRIYGCPVQLGQSEGCIRFDADILKRLSLAAEPELLKIHENLAEQHLNRLNKHELIYKIEKLLGSGLLESNEFSLDHIAEHLDKSPRALRADLLQIESSFEKILSQYREKLARQLLAHTTESIDQIIYLTGFSEPSAFSRAFKRWTGETPTAYRQRKNEKFN